MQLFFYNFSVNTFAHQAADIVAVSTSLLDALPAITSPTESKLYDRIMRTLNLLAEYLILCCNSFFIVTQLYWMILMNCDMLFLENVQMQFI
jgi:hypothetical protein